VPPLQKPLGHSVFGVVVLSICKNQERSSPRFPAPGAEVFAIPSGESGIYKIGCCLGVDVVTSSAPSAEMIAQVSQIFVTFSNRSIILDLLTKHCSRLRLGVGGGATVEIASLGKANLCVFSLHCRGMQHLMLSSDTLARFVGRARRGRSLGDVGSL